MSQVFNCPLCDEFQAPDFRLLLPHIRLVHSTRPNFSLQCNIDNCTRIFRNMKTYANHIYGDHMRQLVSINVQAVVLLLSEEVTENVQETIRVMKKEENIKIDHC